VQDEDRSGFASAVASARGADVVVAVLGDLAGLFGRGSCGEGSDACSLRLPGVQADLLAELTATGTPVVAVHEAGPGAGRVRAGHPAAGRRVPGGVPAARRPGRVHGLAGTRIVEPGLIELAIGSSAADVRLCGELELTGPGRLAGRSRVLTTPVPVTALAAG
jgi:hypothetical protein